MTEKTLLPRQWGKTSAAIYRSNSSKAAIVCFNSERITQILQLANQMNISIPNPVLYRDMLDWKARRGSNALNNIIIDDADIMLSQMFNSNIILLTMTHER